MKYYINGKRYDYTLFEYYLKKSIKYQTDFKLSIKEVNHEYFGYYNDMKYNDVILKFKDKMTYKIEK